MIELQLLEQYRSMFPELVSIAVNSDLTSFKSYISDLSSSSSNTNAAETIMSLLHNDGKTVRELSTGEDIQMLSEITMIPSVLPQTL